MELIVETSCIVTGDRVANTERLKSVLEKQIINLYRNGVIHFWIGLQSKLDLLSAEILIDLRHELSELQLIIVQAGPMQYIGWPEYQIDRYAEILRAADDVITLSRRTTQKHKKQQVWYLVDHAVKVLAVWDGISSCITGNIVEVAYRKKRQIFLIDTDNYCVRYL